MYHVYFNKNTADEKCFYFSESEYHLNTIIRMYKQIYGHDSVWITVATPDGLVRFDGLD